MGSRAFVGVMARVEDVHECEDSFPCVRDLPSFTAFETGDIVLKGLGHSGCTRGMVIIAWMKHSGMMGSSCVVIVIASILVVAERRSVMIALCLGVIRRHIQVLLSLFVGEFEAGRRFVTRFMAIITDEHDFTLRWYEFICIG